MLFVLPGKDGRVTGCTEPPPESQMDYSLTPLLCHSLDTLMLFAANFAAVALSCVLPQNKSNTLFSSTPSLSHSHSFLFIHRMLFFAPQVSLPFFYVSVLMIYFCKNVWPLPSSRHKCLFKEIRVNYFCLRQAASWDEAGYFTVAFACLFWLQPTFVSGEVFPNKCLIWSPKWRAVFKWADLLSRRNLQIHFEKPRFPLQRSGQIIPLSCVSLHNSAGPISPLHPYLQLHELWILFLSSQLDWSPWCANYAQGNEKRRWNPLTANAELR